MSEVNLPWINQDNFESIINENKIVYIYFCADWCAPCRDFSIIYNRVALLFPNIVFAKINIEHEKELAETFNIRSVPHLIVFKESIAIYSDSGRMLESALIDLINQSINADVSGIISELKD